MQLEQRWSIFQLLSRSSTNLYLFVDRKPSKGDAVQKTDPKNSGRTKDGSRKSNLCSNFAREVVMMRNVDWSCTHCAHRNLSVAVGSMCAIDCRVQDLASINSGAHHRLLASLDSGASHPAHGLLPPATAPGSPDRFQNDRVDRHLLKSKRTPICSRR